MLLGWAWRCVGLNRGDNSSPVVASVEWDQIEWMRLYLRGRMTDCYSTQSTRKGMGLVEKKGQFAKKIIQTMGIRPSFTLDSRLFQGLERSVSFMYEVIDSLIVITSPVFLNK